MKANIANSDLIYLQGGTTGTISIANNIVSGENLTVVDIPVGYTHNIENLGNGDMVTVMWVNEVFDPSNPDTYFLKV